MRKKSESKTSKGISTESLALITLVVFSIIFLIALLATYFPKWLNFLVQLIFGVGHINQYTSNCSTSFSSAEDLGKLNYDRWIVTEKTCTFDPDAGENEDYLKFTVDSDGMLSVGMGVEGYPVTAAVYDGDSLTLKVYDSSRSLKCEVSNIPPGGSEGCTRFEAYAGETYYVHVIDTCGSGGSCSEPPDPTIPPTHGPGTVTVSLIEEQQLCEVCVNRGQEWCKRGEIGKCLDHCNDAWWGNCPGGICIKDDSSYCIKPDCGLFDENECDNDPWCNYCSRCKNNKINQWGEDKCVDKGTDCGYSCSIDCPGADCDSSHPCLPIQTCNDVTCKCETIAGD